MGFVCTCNDTLNCGVSRRTQSSCGQGGNEGWQGFDFIIIMGLIICLVVISLVCTKGEKNRFPEKKSDMKI